MRKIVVVAGLFAAAACAARSPYDRAFVSRALEERTGHALAAAPKPGEAALPPGVVLEDGLSGDEAVAVALWNNPRFRADMADLAAARAGLIDAGLLPNPLLSYLHLFGVKGQEGYILWPLDALVQRPKKMAAARLDVERVASRLVQAGLTLGRDVLAACADLELAQASAALAAEDARLRGEMAGIAAARLRAGDISGLEESAARVAGLQAREAALYAARDAETARARLSALLGWGATSPPYELAPGPPPEPAAAALDELVETAYAARPDLRAARAEIDAAAARLGWEKARVLKLTATLEGKEKGDNGVFFGPSGKIELPVFNRNEGGRARARAEMEKAAQSYVAVREQIRLEVAEAFARLSASRQALALLEAQVVPAAAETAARAEKAYAAGEETYLFALEARRQLLDARRREAQAAADVRRADAQLKCGLGSYKQSPDEASPEK
ncbi:MAG TPA: TolC family protein [Candidatus Aminicenantes bacterium]|nr:TolC family protein [Candidatus Aminicenantes bacterium]